MDAKVNITTAETYHVPVMLHETVDGMNIQPGGIYIDLTLGGAGHSKEILARMDGEARLFGFDQDEDAEQNIPADERFTFVRSNFRYLSNFMRYHGVDGEVDAILADLGVSSHHFDEKRPTAGWSFFHGSGWIRLTTDLDAAVRHRARQER
jgi:16S rRNA (cytosine1402-N4)-methyltransferase